MGSAISQGLRNSSPCQNKEMRLGVVGCKGQMHSPNSTPLNFKDGAHDLSLWLYKLKYGKWYLLIMIYMSYIYNLFI